MDKLKPKEKEAASSAVTIAAESKNEQKAVDSLETEDPFLQKQQLLEELKEAKKNWQIARMKLDYVSDQDQIDYAIYALEAAEKRYEMLLRHAKKINLRAIDERTGRWMEVPDELEA